MDIEHQAQDGGGWISGPMTTVPYRELPDVEPLGAEVESVLAELEDRRPEENPALLLHEMANWLRARGKPVDLEGREKTATIAAADMLRAMGVRPVSAPMRRRPDAQR